jgi:hypothetical protein
MNNNHERLYKLWGDSEVTMSKGEPPDPEEVAHAKKVLKKIVDKFFEPVENGA